MERTRLMFRYKALLEEHCEELAALVTRHHGKTLDEARGEVRRGIEVVDFACGAPTLLQGRTLRQVSGGVDQDLYRYPLGVVAGIPPFNFPVMIPLWMMPLAVVAGNTFVLKPSERTPLGAVRLAELFQEAGFPPGVLNVVHGARETVEADWSEQLAIRSRSAGLSRQPQNESHQLGSFVFLPYRRPARWWRHSILLVVSFRPATQSRHT